MSRVVEGADAFTLDGGASGVLLLHGFTANPSGLRAYAEAIHAAGHTVHVPLLPGHGTSWEELGRTPWRSWPDAANRALDELSGRSEAVALVGLSFGAAVALHLAATRGADVRSLALVNPYVSDRRTLAAPIVRYVRRSIPGVVDDISRPGGTEAGYDRVPVTGVIQLARFQRHVRGQLPRVRQPIVVFRSGTDHVIPTGNAAYVLRTVGSKDRELITLPRSYHVAWLDHDADLLFEKTNEFLARTLARPS